MTRVGESRTTGGTVATPNPSPEVGAPRPDPAPSGRASRAGLARRHPARTYGLLLLAAVLVGVAIRLAFLDGQVSSPDEATYLTTGINFWSGRGFTTIAGNPEIHFPPAVPLLLGGIHELVGGDPHTATNVAAVLTSALVILPIAGITRLMAGRRAALIAAAIVMLAPGLVVLPLSSGGSAGPYTLVVVTTVWLALRSWTASPRAALALSVAAGIGTGVAYLARPEGLLFAVVLVPVLVLPVVGGWRGLRRAPATSWRRAGLVALAFLVPLALAVAPYVRYLHAETGRWQLSAKTRDVSIESWRAVANEQRPLRQAILYDVADDGFEFPATRTLPALARDDPGGYLGIVGTNLNRLYDELFDASITPYPHWALLPGALFLLAAFAVWRRRHDRVVLATLAAIAVPIVSAAAFLMQARYLLPSAALACALVAVGLLELPRKWFRVTLAATLFLLVTSTAASLYNTTHGWFHIDRGSREHALAGRFLGAHSRPGDLVMSTTTIPGFYADRATVPTPYTTQARIIEFARHHGVRYLVVDQAHGTRFRPQLRPLAYGNSQWRSDLREVYRHREDGRRLVVYEVLPRPARPSPNAPILGQIGDTG